MQSKFAYAAAAVVVVISAWVADAQLQPESPVATPYISYNSRSFLLNGQPKMIISGEIDYARVPRPLWHDRLVRIKRAGYNTVSGYVFWSAHEPIQGQYNFSNNLDIDAWLTEVQKVGLYAIVRAGPYCCGEWDFGGFPSWLADVPGISLRNSNAAYLSCVNAYFEHLFPILVKHQIDRGGSVIAIQLENEYYPGSYGSSGTPDSAYKWDLIDTAKALGMEVPCIWSWCNNGAEPLPTPFASGPPPWFSTESWTGWIQGYGPPPANYVTQVECGMWKVIAAGTTGITHYMMHGGTNFGYTASDDQRITSYDYYAPIGELGQLRSDYWLVKQGALFTHSFNNILATSTNGASLITSPPAGVKAYVNQSAAGDIAVLTDSTAAASFKVTWTNKSNLQVPTASNWSIPQNKFAHFLANVPISANDTISYSAANIMSVTRLGTTNYIISYGRINSDTAGQIALDFKSAPSPSPAAPWVWNATAQQASLTFTYPKADTVLSASINEGNGVTTSLLTVDSAMADYTWVDSNFIAIGPQYVDDSGNLYFPAQGGRAFIYTPAGGPTIITQQATTAPANKLLNSGWTWRSAALEAGVSYTDTGSLWHASDTPQTMSSYGCPNGYGWYRTTCTAASAGNATLTMPAVHQAAFVFVNGTYRSGTSIPLVQGSNVIAILVAEYNRWKAYNYYSVPTDTCRSGLLGNVKLNGTALTNWRFKAGFDTLPELPVMGDVDTISWTSFLAGQWSASSTAPSDNLPKFWRIDFSYTAPSAALATWTLRSTVARAGRGVVWLNGHCLGRNLESQPPLFVPQCWLSATNTIIVLTENGSAPVNDTLGLVEYFSKVNESNLLTGTLRNGRVLEGASPTVHQTEFTFTGNKFLLPREYAGKKVQATVYDMDGRCIFSASVSSGALKLGACGAGVHMVRLRPLRS